MTSRFASAASSSLSYKTNNNNTNINPNALNISNNNNYSNDDDDDGYAITPIMTPIGGTGNNNNTKRMNSFGFSDSPKERNLNPIDPFADKGNNKNGKSPNADQLLRDLDNIDALHNDIGKDNSNSRYNINSISVSASADPLPFHSPSSSSSTDHIKLGGTGLSNAYEPVLSSGINSNSSSNSSSIGIGSRPSRARDREDLRAAAEIKAELSQVELDRRALQDRENKFDQYENAIQNDINRQKQELQQMMDTMRLEKREMQLRYELQEREKERKKQEEEERSRRERDNLHEALEMLKMQNQMLANKIEEREEQNFKRLEEERAAREQAVEELTAQSKRFTEETAIQQQTVKETIAREREELRSAMKKMDFEKKELAARVEATEEAARQDAILMELQKQEFNTKINDMEKQKDNLAKLVLENELRAKEASAEMSEELAKERQELSSRLQTMEQEKEKLVANLDRTEKEVKSHAESLAEQLRIEKEELKSKVEQMEKEKLDLASHLVQTEKDAAERNRLQSEALSREREELKAHLVNVEKEKLELLKTLNEAEKLAAEKKAAADTADANASSKDLLVDTKDEKLDSNAAAAAGDDGKNNEGAADTISSSASPISTTNTATTTVTEDNKVALDAETEARHQELARKAADEAAASVEALRAELSKKFDDFAAEKAQLAQQLRDAEEQATLREKLMVERMEKEKEELKTSVAKMKEDFLVERRLKLEQSKEAEAALASANGHNNSTSEEKTSDTPKGLAMHPTKSLYDLLENQGQKKDNSMTVTNGEATLNNITPISEGEGDVEEEKDKATDNTTNANADTKNEENEDKDKVLEVPTELQGLPAPHTAAAAGDLRRLRSLANLESSLLSSFDTASRSPLFYAVAYNKPDVAEYLIQMNPDILMHADGHGDTVMHAASSTGSADCLEVILREGRKKGEDQAKAMANIRNSLNMTPAHLALNEDCLRMLLAAGANLSATDSNGRSPLFISCAMNRVECAEYLIDALDHSDDNLYFQDQRGDTPLHAAACNGAVECVLLLLQYGIDPRMANKKGLKAIDLAIRNKQNECREILAEYHLHFCTSSAFDSVLFLATLEGHKQVKHTIEGDEGYKIIKVNTSGNDDDSVGGLSSDGNSNGVAKESKQLRTVASMFSLKKNKSLRLQRWGSWIAYQDQENPDKKYWYNSQTSEGQWEIPESVQKLQTMSEKSSKKGALQSKASMRLKRMGDWIQYMTESNQTFYYNEKTGEFQWANPNEGKGDEPDPSANTDWKPYKDPETGGIFWYNSATKVSQWECPFPGPTNNIVRLGAERADANNTEDGGNANGRIPHSNSHLQVKGMTQQVSGAVLDGQVGQSSEKPKASPDRVKLAPGENPFLLDDDDDEAMIVNGLDDLGL